MIGEELDETLTLSVIEAIGSGAQQVQPRAVPPERLTEQTGQFKEPDDVPNLFS
jgi:hypothetical protein